MFAAYVMGTCGKEYIISKATFENQAAYIAGWKKRLSEDVELFAMAVKEAMKAADSFFGVEKRDWRKDKEDATAQAETASESAGEMAA